MIQTNSANIQAEASAIMLQAVTAITDVNNRHQEADKEAEHGEVYNMTSNLLPCVCVAMYETLLSPSFFEDSLNDGDEEFYYSTVNFDDWKKELTIKAGEYIEDHIIESLRNYGCLNIEAVSIWSPKFYNYHQDELVMDVTMVQDWQSIMAEKIESWRGRQDVEKYINKHWHCYSGYVNFMPESLDEILTERDEERQLAAYLTLAMLVEGCLKDSGDIMEELYYSMENFSDYERINVIEEYFSDSFEADKLLSLWHDDLKWNELYWRLRDKIGSPWRHDKATECLSGKKDCCFDFQADSDGKRLLFWAAIHQHTVDDLYKMTA